jgi:hypothetical protein
MLLLLLLLCQLHLEPNQTAKRRAAPLLLLR